MAQDLGMDGDDATEFFTEFSEKFKVDLHDLGTHWDCHFVPEGGPPLISVVVICGCITAGFMLWDYVGVLPAWGWGIVLIGVALAINQKRVAKKDTRMPVRASDLVESARSGRWSISYPNDTWRYSKGDAEHIIRLRL